MYFSEKMAAPGEKLFCVRIKVDQLDDTCFIMSIYCECILVRKWPLQGRSRFVLE